MFNKTTPIKRGAVVSCRFPIAEAENRPGPSARPALIVRTFFDEGDCVWKAIVAYGTSRQTRANAGYEIAVRKPEQLAAAGLHRASRFTMSRMRILPIDKEFFAYSKNGSPVLGYLPDELMDVLDHNCERLMAVTDELRALMGGRELEVASEAAEPPQQEQYEHIDAAAIDRFFLKACTGRRNLNGAAQEPKVETRRPRRRTHLGRR